MVVRSPGPELPVSSAEVHFVEQAAPSILQDLVGQGGWIGQPELEGRTVERVPGDSGVDTGALGHR